MKKTTTKILILTICLVLILMVALPACKTSSQEGKPLKIGLILDYSGAASPWTAPYTEEAVRLKLDDIGWEVAGRKIELITEDGASNVEVAIEKAKKLVESDQVEVILGVLFGPSVIAVSKYASQVGVCFGTYIGQSMEVVRADPNYSVLATGTLAGGNYELGKYAYNELGYRTAATVYQDFVSGEGFIGGFEVGFKEAGGEIIQRQAVPLGTVDFAPYLTNLEDADCLAYWLAGTMNIFLGQYYDFNIDIPVIVPSSWCLDMEPLVEMGDTPLGILGCGHANEWVTDIKQNEAFVKGMYDRGYAPIQYSYAIYIATTTFLEAVEKTGGDTSPQKLHDAWISVKTDTPAGPVRFDEYGCAIGNLYLYQYSKDDSGNYYWKVINTFEDVPMKCPEIDY